MGIMGFLRERFGKIVAFTIGGALLIFIVSEVVQYGKSYFNGSVNDVGEVDGDKIKKEDFDKKVDQSVANYKQQYGQSNVDAQAQSFLQEQTWTQVVNVLLLQKEIDKLGLAVGVDETQAMISGPNPSQMILQNFANRQTGQLDRAQLNETLGKIRVAKSDDPIRASWASFVTQMIDNKKIEKYLSLVKNGLYVNSLDAKDDYEAKNKLVNFKYIGIDYSSIPDNKVTLTDDDYQSYYDEHKNMFKNKQELRSFDFVAFDASPSKDDSAVVKDQITKLIPEFKASANDSNYVALNAETKVPLVWQKKGQLDPKIDTIISAAKGTVYGPYFSNGSYKIAKLVDARFSPDSVKARHILISIQAAGSLPKALAKADSLKKLIQGGKTFAELAPANSIDQGSAVKGGELGTFTRGQMVPVFDDAVFDGKKGEFKIVTSQYGVHLIEIEDQKGSSKYVKVAVVDKPLEASSKTTSAAYSKAQALLGSLTKDNFDDEVKKSGLTKKIADDINGLASSGGGLDNIRELVRWLFKSGTDKGDISDQVYQSDNQYIVARLSQIKPKGILPLDMVKKQIMPQVLNIVKAKQITPKFDSALNGATTIEQVGQKLSIPVTPVQNVVFANPIVPGSSQENKLIGAMFGSQVNKLSKPIAGDKAVYVYVVDSFLAPTALNNAVRQKQQLGQMMLQRADNSIVEALKNKANVKDYRYKVL